MLPSHTDLTYFIEVTNTPNLSRAAERLGVSQPSLSIAMKRLEQAIGTDLLIRQKNGVLLTPAGKQLQLHATQLLQLWEKTKSRALASELEIQGRVTIGCATVIAAYLLSSIIPKQLSQHPRLEIDIRNDISRKITEGVINLSIDIGIVINPIRHPDLILKKIFTDNFTCWISTDSKSSAHSTPTIICEPSLQQSQILIKKLKQRGSPMRIINVGSLETVAHLTVNGAGIGILPTRVAKFMYPDRLKILKGSSNLPDTGYLIYRNENRRILSVKTVIDSILRLKIS